MESNEASGSNARSSIRSARASQRLSLGVVPKATNKFESPSRLEMENSCVPDEYIDALMDDEYIEKLLVANDHLAKERRERLKRYMRMNQLIFYFLVAQSVVGVWVALYKTVLQPDLLFNAEAELQNIDLMVMVDTAKHNSIHLEKQHQVVVNFSTTLNQSMEGYRQDVAASLAANLTRAQENQGGLRYYFPFLKWLSAGTEIPDVEVHGGWLRIATGIFNARETSQLHTFTRDRSVQKRKLATVTADMYESTGQWLGAFQQCQSLVKSEGHPSSIKFCVIIGDNDAMCRKHVSKPVSEFCERFPQLCPGQDLDKIGNLIEWQKDMEICTNFTNHNLIDELKTEVIFLLTVKNKNDEQQRLSNSGFQRFVKESTGCNVLRKTNETTGKVEYQTENRTCLKFIMAHDLDELAVKSRKVAELLKAKGTIDSEDNAYKDYRYLFYLILPLNLLFYLIWSKILRLGMKVQKKIEIRQGKKKKMIKVTKTLVEKPKRDSVVEMFTGALTQIELAEVSSLRPQVDHGQKMTMRARLRGGYVRVDPGNKNVCDGNGQVFDEASNWTFEPVDADGSSGLQAGQTVKIKNTHGKYLKINEDDETTAFGEDAGEFVVENEGDDQTRFGDTIRIKSKANGKYVRVHKDGKTDMKGEYDDKETQLVIDLGGVSVTTSAVVTLTSIATGAVMYGDNECALGALPGGDLWKYWQLEKKDVPGQGESAESDEAAGVGNQAAAAGQISNLKVGDYITLRSINQHQLAVEEDGVTVNVGTVGEDDDPSSGCQEFIIERIGMGILQQHDNTIRNGAQICLRPAHGPGVSENNAACASNYLNVDREGNIIADGLVTGRSIAFIIDLATMQDMVLPIQDHLLKGDMELLISPLWNKSEVKRLEALSAPWTTEDDLSRFRGAVVVANEKGQYSVPKGKGESAKGWVAVINDGIDIVKATKQAKAQGATGLIIKTSECLSMDKLARNLGQEQPELPAVYVDEGVATELEERGIELKGLVFKGQNRTAALRSIGRAAMPQGPNKDINALKSAMAANTSDVFKNVGALMVEKAEEEAVIAAEEAAKPKMTEQDGEEEDSGAGSGFQWKIKTNTHYLWSTSKGGTMAVDFGKVAPPSAMQKKRINIETGAEASDASKDHVRKDVVTVKKMLPAVSESRGSVSGERRSIVGEALIDAEELTGHKKEEKKKNLLDDDFGQFITEEEASAPMEQLADDSDFKIEYNFEEIEVGVGEKTEEIMEEDLIEDEGTAIGAFAVPPDRFYMVAIGLVVSTLVLFAILAFGLNAAAPDEKKTGPNPLDEGLDGYAAPAAMTGMWQDAQVVLSDIAGSTWKMLRGTSVRDH